LIIYNTKHLTVEKIQNYINQLLPNLTFTPTTEDKNTINFPNLQLIRQPTGIEIDIYRKPTTTDTTINYTSSHPREHKMAARRHLINRMLSLPLSKEKEKEEWKKILTIANNNKFPTHQIEKLKTQITQKNSKNVNTNQAQNKWAIFTYHSPIIRKITNLFKQTDIKIAFRNTNTIRQTIRLKLQDNTQGHEKTGSIN